MGQISAQSSCAAYSLHPLHTAARFPDRTEALVPPCLLTPVDLEAYYSQFCHGRVTSAKSRPSPGLLSLLLTKWRRPSGCHIEVIKGCWRFAVGMETSFQTPLSCFMEAWSQAWLHCTDAWESVPPCPVMCREGSLKGSRSSSRDIRVLRAGRRPAVDAPCLAFTHLDAHVGVVGVGSGSQVLASSLGPQEVA